MPGSNFSLFRRPRVILGAALLSCSVAAQLATVRMHAQVESGINGSVTDATGASLPGATVTIENPATGSVSSTSANSNGDFTISGLNPGHYTVSASAAGFKKEVQNLGETKSATASFSVLGNSCAHERHAGCALWRLEGCAKRYAC